MDNATRMARALADLDKRLRQMERAGQLSRSSVEVNGESVRITDGLAAGLRAEVTAAEAVATASSAEAKADGAVVTFYGVDEPTDAKPGDFWVDNDGLTSVYLNGVWEPLTSSAVTEALVAARNAEAAADGKIVTFFQATEPTAQALGDIWFDTDDNNVMRRWSGTEWVLARDLGIDQAVSTANQAATTAAQASNTANTANSAAAAAQAAADKAKADAAAAQTKATDATTSAIDALNKANAAQTSANTANQAALDAAGIARDKGKVYYSATAPASDPNGLWIKTNEGNKPYRWDASANAWAPVQDAAIQTAANAAATAQSTADTAKTNAATAQTTAQNAANAAATAQTAANTAQTTANNAGAAAQAAQQTADTAKANAATAQQAADTAKTNAATAQSAADAANQKALDAAGIANGKGKVYYQTTAPTGDANSLWIDTTNGANTPKRWNGTAWVAVTDKAATDAATAAANAQTTASNAATAASTAQSAADQAKQAAATAQTKADQAATAAATAQTTADTAKTNAATAQSAADTARQRADAAQTAADNANTKALEAAGIANGKGKVYYQTTAPTADANSLWIDTTNSANTPKRWNGTAWVAVTDKAATDAATAAANAQTAANTAKTAADNAQATANTANTAAGNAQTTANGKNRITYGNAFPANPVTGDVLFYVAGGNQPYKYDAATGWAVANWGDNAISDLNVGKLVTGTLRADTRVIAGPDSGQRTELNSSGLFGFDGDGNKTFALTHTGADYLNLYDDYGSLVASISETGGISGQSVSATSSLLYKGDEMSDVLDYRGRGVVAVGSQFSASAGTTTEVGVFEVAADLYAGRLYEVSTTPLFMTSTVTGDVARAHLRWTMDGTTPNLSTASFTSNAVAVANGGAGTILRRFTTPGSDVTIRVLLTVQRYAGTGTVSMLGRTDYPIQIVIIDHGPYNGDMRAANTGGSATGTVTTTRKRYTKRYAATWSGTYDGGNNLISSKGNEMYQGLYGGTSYRSMVGFNDAQIRADLAGASIVSMKLYLYSNHWYYNSGGTAVIGTHASSSRPATFGGNVDRTRIGGYPKPGGKTVSLINIPQEFQSGATRGITLGPAPSSDLAYYGRFNGAGMANAPYLEFVYDK